MDDNSACPVSSVHQLLPYPISRHEAELHWEMARQKAGTNHPFLFDFSLSNQLRARIAALPSSSFERTVLEEDEQFYATFPQARQAAINGWIAQEFPYATWAQASSVTYEDMSTGIIFGDSPNAHTPISVHLPVPNSSTSTLAHALAFSPSSHLDISAQRPLTIIYDASTKVTERDLDASSIDYVSSDRARSPQGWGYNQQSPNSEIVPVG
ncbi:hypothetical protein C0993_002693 [Termitomyces sp. T159_Od127]|nr:hypothetical protein C0993_002693 [Termitomyces sp. T159_Od127]